MKKLEFIEQINKTREYLDYLEEHFLNVQKAWEEVKKKCFTMKVIQEKFYFNMIESEVKKHDMSKLSEEEFVQYRKALFPTYKEKYEGVPSMDNALQHHLLNNPHHWENWTKKNFNGDYYTIHCMHMILDWMAIGYKFGHTAEEYYKRNKEKIKLPNYAISFIKEVFKRLKENK